MISLFQVAPNDQSLYYLNQIFGTVGTLFSNVASADGTVTLPSQIIGTLFQTINTSVLVLGTLLVVYVTIIGVMATAHEGELFGKKWSGLWIPIRMVLGIVAMFPAAGGYSILQILMMWFITQGIGAADKVWATALNYSQTMGSPFTGSTLAQTNLTTYQQNFKTLFQSLVCQASTRANYQNTYSTDSGGKDRYYYCAPVCGNVYTCPQPPGQYYRPNVDFCNPNSDILNITTGMQVDSTSDVNNIKYKMGPNGACGTLTFSKCNTECTDPDTINCMSCKAQPAALQGIVSVLGSIAEQVVTADNQYMTWKSAPPLSSKETPPPPTPQWIQDYLTDRHASQSSAPNYVNSANRNTPDDAMAIITNYAIKNTISTPDIIQTVLGQWIVNVITTPQTNYIATHAQTNLTDWYRRAYNTGWVFAGAYYYELTKVNRTAQPSPDISFSVSPADQSSGPVRDYRSNYSQANAVLDTLNDASRQGVFASLPADYSSMDAIYGNVNAALLHGMKDNLTDDSRTDPLIKLASYGHYLMDVAVGIVTLLMITVPIIAFAASFGSTFVFGTGMSESPWEEAFKAFMNVLSPFIVLIVSVLFTLGALLGIYIPLLPYIIFTMGVIGWMTGVIEAMVAAPFVALGILSPAGQHELLGKAEPAVMYLFNIFLRPTLMVFGLIIAMLLSVVVIKFINAAFMDVVSAIEGPEWYIGLFEQIVWVAAYTLILFTALNKCFSMIHVPGEKVLTWLGGQQVAYGEGESLEKVKQGTEAAGGATVGAGKETGAAAKAGGESTGAAGSREKRSKEDAARKARLEAASQDKGSGQNNTPS